MFCSSLIISIYHLQHMHKLQKKIKHSSKVYWKQEVLKCFVTVVYSDSPGSLISDDKYTKLVVSNDVSFNNAVSNRWNRFLNNCLHRCKSRVLKLQSQIIHRLWNTPFFQTEVLPKCLHWLWKCCLIVYMSPEETQIYYIPIQSFMY